METNSAMEWSDGEGVLYTLAPAHTCQKNKKEKKNNPQTNHSTNLLIVSVMFTPENEVRASGL